MRVAVVTSSPPFAEGGHLVMARALVRALGDAGHDAGLILTPQNRFGRQCAAYFASYLTDVGTSAHGPIDQVITLRYPAYAVRHPNHVCWLNHTMREYYDQWARFRGPLSWKNRIKEGARRQIIHMADRHLLKQHVRRLFTISATVQARLDRFLSVASTVLHPPAPQRAYRCDGHGDYFFAVSRLTPLKRMDLMVRALAEPAASGVRSVVAGEGEEAPRLARLASDLGVADRITFLGRASDQQVLDHLARCRAVCFPPFDEDYGFVTVEAFASGKAVITCHDSGGAAELVRDRVNGLVCEPTPAALAHAMATLMGDRNQAIRLGEAGAATAASLRWEDAVRTLVA